MYYHVPVSAFSGLAPSGLMARPSRKVPSMLRITRHTVNLPTNIADFRGFNSSMILMLRGGILMSIGNSPESLSQAMLVGIMLVGGFGILSIARMVRDTVVV